MGDQTAQLGWVGRLPEVGTLASMSFEEAKMLERRAELLRQIAAIDARLVTMRKCAEIEAAAQWTAEEISAAKAAG